VWPLVNIINFAFVPPAQRILFVNLVAIVFVAFLSYLSADVQSKETAEYQSKDVA
jgi:hypothetical protein